MDIGNLDFEDLGNELEEIKVTHNLGFENGEKKITFGNDNFNLEMLKRIRNGTENEPITSKFLSLSKGINNIHERLHFSVMQPSIILSL